MLLYFLNCFFLVSHVLLILFTLFGWIPKRTRKVHLIVIMLTAFSWFVLGIWFGFGYCFWTDWHWQVRRKLGYHIEPSYVKFLLDSLTGGNWDAGLVDTATAIGFLIASLCSLFVNRRLFRR